MSPLRDMQPAVTMIGTISLPIAQQRQPPSLEVTLLLKSLAKVQGLISTIRLPVLPGTVMGLHWL